MIPWYDEVPAGSRATTPQQAGPRPEPQDAPEGEWLPTPGSPQAGAPDGRRWSGRRTAAVAALVLGLTSVGGVAAAMATPAGIAGPSDTSRLGGPGGFPGGAPGGQTGRGFGGPRGQGFPGQQGQQGFLGGGGADPQQGDTSH